MRLKIIRQSDAQHFDLNAVAYGPFVLDASALIPGGSSLDVSGYEFSGRDGGYQTASRLQRRPFTIPFAIREERTTQLGLFELIRQAQGFFVPHSDDLSPYLYNVEVYTDDRNQTSFQMRNGTISVPLNSKTLVGECIAQAQISFIFGDPYLYPIGDSGLTLTLFAGGQATGTPNGRRWDSSAGALWTTANGKTWVTSGGSGDPITVDVITIATVPVSIETSGQLIDPQIVNLTNGSSFSYDGTLSPSDVLTVDILGNVLVNGNTPSFPFSGSLTAINGANTFALLAAGSSPGSAELTILGAF